MGVMLSVDERGWLECRCVREDQELVALAPLNGTGWDGLIGHSCIACHSLTVQVLTYGAGWGPSACHKYTRTCSYTAALPTASVTSGPV